jgi:hypothetical protein
VDGGDKGDRDWRRLVVSRIVESKYSDYTAAVVRLLTGSGQAVHTIGALGPECRQSGDDSPLENVWEEFKAQIQGEQSGLFESYEETIRSLCTSVVSKLAPAERMLLWLESEAYWNWDEDTAEPHDSEIQEDVSEELYCRVCTRAADEPLAHEEESDGDSEDEEEPP